MPTYKISKTLQAGVIPAGTALPRVYRLKPAIHRAVRQAEAESHQADRLLAQGIVPERISPASAPVITAPAKPATLIDTDIEFDDSQQHAISSLVLQQYGCMTGAAGTGKTTCTQAIIDRLIHSLGSVDINSVWRGVDRGDAGTEGESRQATTPAAYVPSVALCAYTGRATEQIKLKFPESWHRNIMTIHRMLAYAPEYEDDPNAPAGELRQRMVFRPRYNASHKLPWDIIIIDEAGMVGLDLWEAIWDACTSTTRIYIIGDINQLPPVQGRPMFGFALNQWPAYELTHIHRQKGKSNPIVDNAWRILKGQQPRSEGSFQLFNRADGTPALTGNPSQDAARVVNTVKTLWSQNRFDPFRDIIITATNGYDGQRGQQLGQIPLNKAFAETFNPRPPSERFIIDAGRNVAYYSLGDKVMVTKNDHTIGITNGMTGRITSIKVNDQYIRPRQRFGSVEEVNERLSDPTMVTAESGPPLTIESFLADIQEQGQEKPDESGEEKGLRGPASHVVTVEFTIGGKPKEIEFRSMSEVDSLQLAYVITCHKSQGGEYPFVIVICHDTHRRMLYREWLYTAVTRTSERCLVMHTRLGLAAALHNQKIKGTTLAEKARVFEELSKPKGGFAGVGVTLPAPRPAHKHHTAKEANHD